MIFKRRRTQRQDTTSFADTGDIRWEVGPDGARAYVVDRESDTTTRHVDSSSMESDHDVIWRPFIKTVDNVQYLCTFFNYANIGTEINIVDIEKSTINNGTIGIKNSLPTISYYDLNEWMITTEFKLNNGLTHGTVESLNNTTTFLASRFIGTPKTWRTTVATPSWPSNGFASTFMDYTIEIVRKPLNVLLQRDTEDGWSYWMVRPLFSIDNGEFINHTCIPQGYYGYDESYINLYRSGELYTLQSPQYGYKRWS